MTLKIKKIASGYYLAAFEHREFEIVAYNTDVKEAIWWGWSEKNKLGYFGDAQDSFSTKRRCVEAIIDWIKNN